MDNSKDVSPKSGTSRDESILPLFSPIFLSSNSFLIYLLCSIFCSHQPNLLSIIVIVIEMVHVHIILSYAEMMYLHMKYMKKQYIFFICFFVHRNGTYIPVLESSYAEVHTYHFFKRRNSTVS